MLTQPYSYFNPKSTAHDLKKGDLVDVLKTGKSFSDKVSWSRGHIQDIDEINVQVAYLYDCHDATAFFK